MKPLKNKDETHLHYGCTRLALLHYPPPSGYHAEKRHPPDTSAARQGGGMPNVTPFHLERVKGEPVSKRGQHRRTPQSSDWAAGVLDDTLPHDAQSGVPPNWARVRGSDNIPCNQRGLSDSSRFTISTPNPTAAKHPDRAKPDHVKKYPCAQKK